MSFIARGLSGITDRFSTAGRRESGASTPARIMMPRIVLVVTTLALVLFGLLMIYSSSSIVGLTSDDLGNNPAYYLVKQLLAVGGGTVLAIVLSAIDYHRWTGNLLKAVWVVTLVLLLIVYLPSMGHEEFGATRWINLGFIKLQPSEFAKVTVLLVGAYICEEYFWRGSLETGEAIKLAAAGVGVPLLLILLQPDKGTTGILALTLIVMIYLSGVSGVHILLVGAGILAAALAYAFIDDYSRARILTVINPFSDPYGDGYQIVQGLYAFGSGGLTGVGLGFSRQKYNYLPMAHNDFIFAVIGEELGLLGTIGVLAAFVALLWAGFKIAENAPDLMGRLIAAGCTSLLVIQLLLNVSGVLGMFPLSGKPVPFISYGGSSVISCLMLVGLVTSVSIRSALPETAHDRRRAQLHATDEVQGDWGDWGLDSNVGMPLPRSARPLGRGVPLSTARTYQPSLSWRVIEGGDSDSVPAERMGRMSRDARGRTRLDLGPSAAERLRGACEGSSSRRTR